MGHIHGNSEYDYTVRGVIVHEGKVLLLFHHKLDFWLPPGGHVELDETPIEAVYREIKEETGLTKEHLELVLPFKDNLALERDEQFSEAHPMPFDIDVHTINEGGHQHIDLAYIFRSDTAAIRAEEGGAQELKWCTLEEMRELTPLPRKTYGHAEYALKKVKELQK